MPRSIQHISSHYGNPAFDHTQFQFAREDGCNVFFVGRIRIGSYESDKHVYLTKDEYVRAGKPKEFTGAEAREYGWKKPPKKRYGPKNPDIMRNWPFRNPIEPRN